MRNDFMIVVEVLEVSGSGSLTSLYLMSSVNFCKSLKIYSRNELKVIHYVQTCQEFELKLPAHFWNPLANLTG